jgi:hypothetical protein
MKKISVIILLVTYAFASSGLSADLHYCMGKLVSWNLDYTSNNDCRNCGMKTKPDKGCCDNKQIHPNIDKEQQATDIHISLNNDFIAVVSHYSVRNFFFFTQSTSAHHSIHGPPLISPGPLYLFNCNFRI